MYPNAFGGIKKVFNAEILSLIATILLGLGSVFAAAGAATSTLGALTFGGVFIVVGLVAFLVSYIMNLVGLHQAAKDEPKFKTAFILSIVALILTLAGGAISSGAGETAQTIISIISSILKIAITVAIISGIMNLADRLNDPKLKEKGKNILILWVVIYVIALILQLVKVPALTVGLSVVSLVLIVVVYIFYLSYLSKATKMLENN